MDTLKQGAIGFTLVAGLVVAFCSGLVFFLSGFGTVTGALGKGDPGPINVVSVSFVFIVIGVLMVFGAVIYGLYSVSKENEGPIISREAKVLARYAFNREGLMLISDWEIEIAENPRYYARLDLGPELGTLECECTLEVFYQAGEGMTGIADLQGKWLGAFRPHLGANYRSEHITEIITRGE